MKRSIRATESIKNLQQAGDRHEEEKEDEMDKDDESGEEDDAYKQKNADWLVN